MSHPRFSVLPVDNGDMILTKLSDGRVLQIDCNITDDSSDPDKRERYDVVDHLLNTVRKVGIKYILDVFLNTHPDKDHLWGIKKAYYLGDPAKYSSKDADDKLVIIGELWFSPQVFNEYIVDLSEHAEDFRKEADRRIKLHKNNDPAKDDEGNRIRIIGKTDDDKYKGLEHLMSSAGEVVDTFNGKASDELSVFIHAPFSRDLDDDRCDRNDTSVVVQLRFKLNGVERATQILLGGDASWRIWKDILKFTSDDKDLNFDIMVAPHHCSWTFFNDTPQDENTVPESTSLEVLDKKRAGAIVIASSKKIKNDDDNPPHYASKQEYVKKVGAGNFRATGEEHDGNKKDVIEYELTMTGPRKYSLSSRITTGAVAAGSNRQPHTYGQKEIS